MKNNFLILFLTVSFFPLISAKQCQLTTRDQAGTKVSTTNISNAQEEADCKAKGGIIVQ